MYRASCHCMLESDSDIDFGNFITERGKQQQPTRSFNQCNTTACKRLRGCYESGTVVTKTEFISNIKQDRQCMYVTLRLVRESFLTWKIIITYLRVCVRVSQRVGVCMRVHACSLANPACNAYAPCCDVICGPSGSTIFFDIIS